MQGCDALIHCAALVGEGIPREELFRVNAGGVTKILEAAREAGVHRAIVLSSLAVLGTKAHHGTDESAPLRPHRRPLPREQDRRRAGSTRVRLRQGLPRHGAQANPDLRSARPGVPARRDREPAPPQDALRRQGRAAHAHHSRGQRRCGHRAGSRERLERRPGLSRHRWRADQPPRVRRAHLPRAAARAAAGLDQLSGHEPRRATSSSSSTG